MGKHHNMGSKTKRRAMRTLHEIQGGCCAYCRFPVAHPDSSDRPESGDALEPSLDHVRPRGRGGSNALTNLILAHRGCNEDRRDGRLPTNARSMWRQNLALLAQRAAQPEQEAA